MEPSNYQPLVGALSVVRTIERMATELRPISDPSPTLATLTSRSIARNCFGVDEVGRKAGSGKKLKELTLTQ